MLMVALLILHMNLIGIMRLKRFLIQMIHTGHKDYVQEILKKAQIYGKGHRENLMRDFPELFSSDEELIQAIFSNYICEEDMLKRPLSKITMDLLKELSII